MKTLYLNVNITINVIFTHVKNNIEKNKFNPKTNMSRKEDFIKQINDGYLSKGESIILGGAILDGEALADAHIKVPLKTLNRHGLIAGATGTGKTEYTKALYTGLVGEGKVLRITDVEGLSKLKEKLRK